MKHSLEILAGRELVSQAVRAIRKKRGLSAPDVARRMGLGIRTFEEFEGGRGPMTDERVLAFAEATDSDPFALLLCPIFGSAQFAVDCADTKLVMIMMMHLEEFVDREGSDIIYLEPPNIIGGFERVFRELSGRLSERETFLQNWLDKHTGAIGLAALRSRASRKRPKPG